MNNQAITDALEKAAAVIAENTPYREGLVLGWAIDALKIARDAMQAELDKSGGAEMAGNADIEAKFGALNDALNGCEE